MRNQNKYLWAEIVSLYMGDSKIPPMDHVIQIGVTEDKQAEAIYGQLIAQKMGWA
jgi:hypothetical protein